MAMHAIAVHCSFVHSHIRSYTCCAQMGCKECVWDVYWQDLKAYDAERARREGKVPPLDPFEELERRLAASDGSGGG